MSSHFAVSKGWTICEIYLILCTLELIIKRKAIIFRKELIFFFFVIGDKIILLWEPFIFNILTSLLPLTATSSLSIFWIYIRFHSPIKKNSSFPIITNINSNFLIRKFLVRYPKVKPLHVTPSVCVGSKEQIVLWGWDLNN